MIGAKLKIALLYDLWNEDPVAAAAKEERSNPARKSHKKVKKVKKGEDRPRGNLRSAAEAGTRAFELRTRWTSAVAALARASCDADLIFNLTESFDGDDTKEMNVVAYVDLLGLRYTGAGPHSIFMCAGQSDRQENLCVPRHQDSVLCDFVSRTH